MNETYFVRQGLYLHGIPVHEADIPYMNDLLSEVSYFVDVSSCASGLKCEIKTEEKTYESSR